MKLSKHARETLDINLESDIKELAKLSHTDGMYLYYEAHLEGILDTLSMLDIRMSKGIDARLRALEALFLPLSQ